LKQIFKDLKVRKVNDMDEFTKNDKIRANIDVLDASY
jgi:hypothetical protein